MKWRGCSPAASAMAASSPADRAYVSKVVAARTVLIAMQKSASTKWLAGTDGWACKAAVQLAFWLTASLLPAPSAPASPPPKAVGYATGPGAARSAVNS